MLSLHILILFLLTFCLATTPHGRHHASLAVRGSLAKPKTLSQASNSDLAKARALVAAAIKNATEHNKARVEKPLRNQYVLAPNTNLKKRQEAGNSTSGDVNEDVAPLFDVTDEIKKAAALVAEAEAFEAARVNGTSSPIAKRVGNWWMGNLDGHQGAWPWGNNSADYKVFRNVKDWGAKGDGVTDDTAAINKAVADFKACGPGCYSSTTKGAIIYFPPGTYLVSSTIETYYGTQFIGDAVNRPTIKAASSFVGLGVISTDHYVENGGTGSDGNAKEWFINTANFYRQIRNFIIDITATDQGAYVAAVHYQVAQATSLSFVEFKCTQSSTTTQQAIFAENGSGGFISDLVFNGGAFGIYGGSQQFTAHRLTFNNVRTAVQIIWDWGWVWKSIRVKGGTYGFKLMGENDVHNTGSVMVVDSIFTDTDTAIYTYGWTNTTGDLTSGVTLDNVRLNNVAKGVSDKNKVYLAGKSGGTVSIDTWVQGRVYSGDRQYQTLNTPYNTPRDVLLVGSNPDGLPKAPFFEKAKPQYTDVAASSFTRMAKTCKGDGKTDVTSCFQNVINSAGNKVVFIDAGTYMLSDTIKIPMGARIVGENWAQLAAFGSKFTDIKNPKPLLRVGEPGDVGNVEIQDLIFTSKGNTPGLVFVEWNMRAANPGSAGMWDAHVRVGGAVGTGLTSKECPPSTTGTNSNCIGGSALMRVTASGSGYFENVWLWVADHDIDDPDWNNNNNFMTQCSVYVARGLLIESTNPTWLYGTASEHAIMYQYEFSKARHVYASMIQTESPYFQPNPLPPRPVQDAVGVWKADPKYTCSGSSGSGCDASWALIIQDCTNVTIHGAGLYSWFKTYSQTCVDTINCQNTLIKLDNNHGGVTITNIVTIGSVNMIESDGTLIKAKDNLAVNFHPYWSQIAVYDTRQYKNNPCSGEPVFANPNLPDGPGSWGAIRLENDPELRYLTIVNGCPYDMVVNRAPNNHQMLNWNEQWITIPARESVQFTVGWSGSGTNFDDTAGEAYYRLDGTQDTFQVSATARDQDHNLWGLRTRIKYDGITTRDEPKGTVWDLDVPGYFEGVTQQWVLTGSHEYGYISSANPPTAWMHSILDVIGDRKLRHVCMPGSHDAGMSKINGHTAHSDWANTQTQWLDIYGQLVRGSRWFDIRPCLGNGGVHLLCHYSPDTAASGSQGANGIEVDEAITMINRFMNDFPGELVILDINADCGFDSDGKRDSSQNYPRLTAAQWSPIIAKFRDNIKKPCRGFDAKRDLTTVTMNEFIGDGQGCVLSVTRSIPSVTPDPSKGFFTDASFPRTGDFSSTSNYKTLAEGQVSRLKLNRNLKGDGVEGNQDTFFVMHWETTIEISDIITPISARAASVQSPLFWYAYREFTPFSYPNVIYVDFLGQPFQLPNGLSQDEYLKQTQNHMTGLALAVNLGIASANCHVGGGNITLTR